MADKQIVLNIFGVLVLLGQLGIVVLFWAWILSATGWSVFDGKAKKVTNFLSENYIALACLIAVAATLGSLVLSEVLHFIPCKLCWYQRIFMFPQAIIFGVALWKNDRNIWRYSIALSVIGLLIAIYHIFLQTYPGVFPCSDEVANCTLSQFKIFNYITIPVMSATAFIILILLGVFGKRRK